MRPAPTCCQAKESFCKALTLTPPPLFPVSPLNVCACAFPSPIAGLPWVPASLRFIRAARQWLLLCLHHPRARSLPVLQAFAGTLLLQLKRSVAGQSKQYSGRSFMNSDMFSRPALEGTMVREP
jgi:hypothetical protein